MWICPGFSQNANISLNSCTSYSQWRHHGGVQGRQGCPNMSNIVPLLLTLLQSLAAGCELNDLPNEKPVRLHIPHGSLSFQVNFKLVSCTQNYICVTDPRAGDMEHLGSDCVIMSMKAFSEGSGDGVQKFCMRCYQYAIIGFFHAWAGRR